MSIINRISVSFATVSLVTVALLVLAGCAPQQPAMDSATADSLNTTVVAVATAAQGDDPVGAVAQLDVLQAQLDAAVSSGAVTGERAAGIQASIDLVRLDLAALVALVPTPSATPTPSPSPDDRGDDDEKPGKPEKPGRGDKPDKDDD